MVYVDFVTDSVPSVFIHRSYLVIISKTLKIKDANKVFSFPLFRSFNYRSYYNQLYNIIAYAWNCKFRCVYLSSSGDVLSRLINNTTRKSCAVSWD